MSTTNQIPPGEPAYKVGPGRPPREHQWKPGQSGNPKGAKRKPKSLLPDLKRLFTQGLSQKVTVKQGEKNIDLTMAEAGIRQLIAQFAKGDRHARRDVIAFAKELGIDLMTGHRTAIEEALAVDHQAIVDGYVARRQRKDSGSPRVMAPPGLLDD
jgi:hypothetical protein